MASKRYYTTQELIDLVESDEFWKADVFITPPDDGAVSEEDSGDEDNANIDHLSGRQLNAGAVATVNQGGKILHLGDDDSEYDEDDIIPLAEVQNNLKIERQISNVNPVRRKWISSSDISNSLPSFRQPDKNQRLIGDRNESQQSAIMYFEYFFDDHIWDHLVNMTNLYAKQKGDHDFNMDVSDLKCFIGILLLSGHVRIPRWRLWWEVDTDTYNPLVAQSMRRNRFEQIKKYIHCADNNNLVPNDKFSKVRPLFDMLNQRFLEYAPLSERLSIDESMVPYFGRHGAKQFVKGKPLRYGYKLWCLCEPLGYLTQFIPYQGKEENRCHTDIGLGGSVVMNLISKLPPNSYKIYGDRYFSSLKLANRLQSVGIGYTGTIKINRTEKCPIIQPKELMKKPRGTYEFVKDESSNTGITAWNDNTAVYVVSTCDTSLPLDTVKRWISSEKQKRSIPQPNTIKQYNMFMGGVDRMDQNIENYRIAIRSKKWWWAVFAFCVDSSIHNAWQLYRKEVDKKTDFLKFRREVVQTYLKKYGCPSSQGTKPKTSKNLSDRVPDAIRFDNISHWIVPATKQGRCALCKKNSTKSCEKCNICLHEQCFKQYHVL